MGKSKEENSYSAILSTEDIEKLAVLVAELLGRKTIQQFLNERDAANLVGLTPRSLQAMRYEGTGPAFVKFGEGQRAPVRYCRSELIRWAESHQRRRDHLEPQKANSQ